MRRSEGCRKVEPRSNRRRRRSNGGRPGRATVRRDRSVGSGSTDGLDSADVDGPRTGVKGGKWSALIDRVHPTGPWKPRFSSRGRNKGPPGSTCDGDDVRGPPGSELKASRGAAQSGLSTPAIRRALHPKREQGVAADGDYRTVRARGRSDGGAARYWNRSASGTSRSTVTAFAPGGMQGRPEPSGRVAQGGLHNLVDADLKSYFDTIPHDRMWPWWVKRCRYGRRAEPDRVVLKKASDGLRDGRPRRDLPRGCSAVSANSTSTRLDHLMAERGISRW